MRPLLPMKAELKAFFKAFTYAFAGIAHGIKCERNIRFHLCAAVTVLAFMGFYNFTVSEKCVVFLCIGGVIAAELMNTAVENAADLYGIEKSPAAKAAKDCAAGAVLIMSVCAFVCGITLFGDIETIMKIRDYFVSNPIAAAGGLIWACTAFLFVFGFEQKKK